MYYSFLILIYKKILLFQTFDGQQKTAENGVSTTTGNLQCGHITVQKPSNRERNDNNITSENRCLFFISIYINIRDNFSELEKEEINSLLHIEFRCVWLNKWERLRSSRKFINVLTLSRRKQHVRVTEWIRCPDFRLGS